MMPTITRHNFSPIQVGAEPAGIGVLSGTTETPTWTDVPVEKAGGAPTTLHLPELFGAGSRHPGYASWYSWPRRHASDDVSQYIFERRLEPALEKTLAAAAEHFGSPLEHNLSLCRPGFYPDDSYLDIVLRVELNPEEASATYFRLLGSLAETLDDREFSRLNIRYLIK